jgi:hypothetical protein
MNNKIFISLSIILILCANKSFAYDSLMHTVPLERFSGKVYSEKVSRYRIKSKNKIIMPDTHFQKVLDQSRTGNFYIILIRAGETSENDSAEEDMEKYLANSRLLELDDPEIAGLKPLFGKSKDVIYDVETFVYKRISRKIAGVPIIPAGEILKNRTGDCTEHTVLAVSILRSLGIPSRAIVGMILSADFEGMRNVLVYHMWAEAYVNGKWVLVDATSPGQKHPNRYISIAYHHLQTEMPLSYLKAVSAMKSFTVEYVE